ncbi:TPCN2 [Acanthosepion pharaonis]|uniref:TPCN2 n=1 Tax=Acanthosepion pharaonis TaxID=158019 RepID=A0A812EY88_ACAPH|nr:TPCN2 [Sepia pharaonis]
MNLENDFPPAAVNGIDGLPTQSKRRKGATMSQPSNSMFLDGDDDGGGGRENSCDSEGMPHPRASNIQIRGENNDAFYEAETEADTDPDSHHQYYHLMDDGASLLQAVVFVEDAFHYRSIHHKVDRTSLRLYRFQYSYLTTTVSYLQPVPWLFLKFNAIEPLPSTGGYKSRIRGLAMSESLFK